MDADIRELRKKARKYSDPRAIASLAAALSRLKQPAICEYDGHYIIYNIEVFDTHRTTCWLKDSDPKQKPRQASEQQESFAQLPRIQPDAPHELPPLPIYLASIKTALQLRNDPELGITAQQFLTFIHQHTQRASLFNTSTRFKLGTTDTITHGTMLNIRQHAPALRAPDQECTWMETENAMNDCDTVCYALTGMLSKQVRDIISQLDNTKDTDLQIVMPIQKNPREGAILFSLTHSFGNASLTIYFQSLPEKQIKGGTTIPVTYL